MSLPPFDVQGWWSRADLEQIYPVPDVPTARRVIDRHRHADLRALSRTCLKFEHARLMTRIEHDANPSPWLFDRARAIVRRLAHGR